MSLRKIPTTRISGLASNYSFEEHEVAQAMDGDELAVHIEENGQDVSEISQDLGDAAVLEEKAVALEELAEAAENIDSATPAEVQLVDLSADLATAGTDEELEVFQATDDNASFESFAGKRISTEGIENIKATAKRYWEAIKALVARLWERILGFWRRITDQVPGLVKRARAMAKRAGEVTGSLKEKGDKISLGAEGKRLAVNGSAPKNNGDLVKGLEALSNTSGMFLKDYATHVFRTLNGVANKLASFDLKNAEASLAAVNSEAQLTTREKKIIGQLTAVTGDKRFGSDYEVKRSEHLPNNVCVFMQYSAKASDGSALGNSQFIRSAGVHLLPSSEKEVKLGEMKFDTMTPSQVSTLADQIEAMAEIVKTFNKDLLRNLEKAAIKVKESGNKAEAAVSDKTSSLELKYLNSALQYNTAAAKWSASPFTQLTALIISTCNAAIAVGNKSLSQYKA